MRTWFGYEIHTAAGVHTGNPSTEFVLMLPLQQDISITDSTGMHRLPAAMSGLQEKPGQSRDGEQRGLQLGLTSFDARLLLGALRVSLPGRPSTCVPHSVLMQRCWWNNCTKRKTGRFAIARLHNQLLAHRTACCPIDPRLSVAWRRLNYAHEPGPGQQVVNEIGWTRPQLRNRFLREFGVSPVRLGRIARFNRARHQISRFCNGNLALAEIAAHNRYTDQAHMNRDWHAFTGRSPAAWFAAEFPFVQRTNTVTARGWEP